MSWFLIFLPNALGFVSTPYSTTTQLYSVCEKLGPRAAGAGSRVPSVPPMCGAQPWPLRASVVMRLSPGLLSLVPAPQPTAVRTGLQSLCLPTSAKGTSCVPVLAACIVILLRKVNRGHQAPAWRTLLGFGGAIWSWGPQSLSSQSPSRPCAGLCRRAVCVVELACVLLVGAHSDPVV